MPILKDRFAMKWLGMYFTALLAWLGTTAMHIPDGYLSPSTSIVLFLLVLPFWVIGVRKIRQTMNARSVPLIALVAAFSFVIMMFNIPLPGGTTGHAVGAALAAIVLGPEVATIAISIALIIQALFFGDGGILAIGANSFNMAVVAPYVSYAVYRAISRNSALTSARRVVGAALGGWIGLTVAALFAGIMFGLQPLLFHAADGTPLYAPYPLAVAVPAMVLPHLAVASVVEGLLTALVVAYLQRSNVAVLEAAEKPAAANEAGSLRKLRWVWVRSRHPGGGLAAGAAGAGHGLGRVGHRGTDQNGPGDRSGRVGKALRAVGRAAGRITTCRYWATSTWAICFRHWSGYWWWRWWCGCLPCC